MPAWQRSYAALCAFTAAFILGYAGCDYFRWTRPIYQPALRQWSLASQLGRLPIGYYGQLLWALGCGLGAALVVWLGTHLARRPLGAQALQLAAGWTLGVAGIAIAYFSWHNWP